MLFATVLATLVASVAAAKDRRTFAVLQHYGRGPLTTCRADPIVAPGGPSAHLHTIMGASGFGFNATGESLKESRCTTALPKADLSSYWMPTLFFKDPETGLLEQVPFFYMNVYYFFDATNDDIKSFPTGLQIVSGQPSIRAAPARSGNLQLDPSRGPIQAAQVTCPRGNFNPRSWPAGSDGSMAGIQDDNNQGSGIGFPFQDCDGYSSPMRMDVHMPSCYDPSAGLTNYKNNMRFPTPAANGRLDCPPGWIHVPHLFYEMYWDTHSLLPRFQNQIGKESPFVFSNGDATGFSLHADFIAGWDEAALQNIIDNCDVGHQGIHSCPGYNGGVNDRSTSCNIECPVNEVTTGRLQRLPGNNPLAGWQYGNSAPVAAPAPNPAPANPPAPAPTSTRTSTRAQAAPTAAPPPPPPPAPAPASSSAAPPPPPPPPPAPKPESTTLSSVVRPVAISSPPPAVPTPPPAPTPAPASSSRRARTRTRTVWNTVTVWQTTTVTSGPQPTSAPASGGAEIAGFKYVGCYSDSAGRVLSGKKLPNIGAVSNTACVEYCSSKGFAFAGTEYGGECFCGNDLSTVQELPEEKCSMKCKGNADQTCGGDWALSLFSKSGSEPSTSYKKRHLHEHAQLHRRGSFHKRR